MTWEPKNKLDDEDVDVSDDEDKDNSFCRDEKSGKQTPSVPSHHLFITLTPTSKNRNIVGLKIFPLLINPASSHQKYGSLFF